MCVHVCTYVCMCLWSPEENVGPPGAGVTGDSELPSVSAGPELRFPTREGFLA